MLNNERTPLLAGDDDDSIISKNSAIIGENGNQDPEALADDLKIPGLKLGIIIPAMAIGVRSPALLELMGYVC